MSALEIGVPVAEITVSTTEIVTSNGAPRNYTAGRRDDAPRARIVIADQGSGIDHKTQARLFEPFFTTKKRGTGLGLSIVRQIIDLHGGTIEVESEAGKGTTFRVGLPLNSPGSHSDQIQ